MTIREQVSEFHRKFNVPHPDRPTRPRLRRLNLRLDLIREELRELEEACGFYTCGPNGSDEGHSMDKFDMVAVADALADLDYVVEGMRQELGVNGEPIAAEVHRTNMAKVGGATRHDGKILKPPGWTPPDIAGELRKQGWEP